MRICWLLIWGWISLSLLPGQGSISSLLDNQAVLGYDLEIQLDPDHQSVAGTQRIKLRLQRSSGQSVFLLSERLRLVHVKYQGQALTFDRKGDTVRVDYGRRLEAGTTPLLEILYGGQPEAPAEVWSGGNVSLDASLLPPQGWWPCLPGVVDSLQLHVIFPQEAAVMTSGMLSEQTLRPGRFLRRSFEHPYPTRPEQVRLYAGTLLEVVTDHAGPEQTRRLHYLAATHDSAQAQAGLQQLQQALTLLEAHWGPYPFWHRPFYWVSTPTVKPSPALGVDGALLRRLAGHWFGRSLRPADELARQLLNALRAYAEIMYVEKTFDRNTAQHYLYNQAVVPLDLCFWEAVRSTLPKKGAWWPLFQRLHEVYADTDVTGDSLLDWFEAQLGIAMRPLVEQYLLHGERPQLQYRTVEERRSSTLLLRWQTEAQDLSLEVQFQIGKEVHTFSPSAQWQEHSFKRITPDDIAPRAGQQYLRWEYTEP